MGADVTLNAKQSAFVSEYLVDLNATQAAIRAGYSEKTAYSIGHENLSKPDIAAAIAAAQQERAKANGITVERVLREVSRLAFSDVRKAFDESGNLKLPQDIDDDTAAALAGIDTVTTSVAGSESPLSLVTKKIKVFDKGAALTLAMRHLGMFNDKVTVDATVQGDVVYKAFIPPRGKSN